MYDIWKNKSYLYVQYCTSEDLRDEATNNNLHNLEFLDQYNCFHFSSALF